MSNPATVDPTILTNYRRISLWIGADLMEMDFQD